jgi:hypothetical protein
MFSNSEGFPLLDPILSKMNVLKGSPFSQLAG